MTDPRSPTTGAALIEEHERDRCTGLAASWCPIHGDCTCPDRERAMDSEHCPLHSRTSDHCEREEDRW